MFIWEIVGKLIKQILLYGALVPAVLGIMYETGDYTVLILMALTIFVLLVIIVIYPVVIWPLQAKLRPLEDGDLKTLIMQEEAKTKMKINTIYIEEASRKTAHSNAFVAGVGANRRIVIYDNLIKLISSDELVAVINHELGHGYYQHALIGACVSIVHVAILFGLFALIYEHKQFL